MINGDASHLQSAELEYAVPWCSLWECYDSDHRLGIKESKWKDRRKEARQPEHVSLTIVDFKPQLKFAAGRMWDDPNPLSTFTKYGTTEQRNFYHQGTRWFFSEEQAWQWWLLAANHTSQKERQHVFKKQDLTQTSVHAWLRKPRPEPRKDGHRARSI